jgi:DNA repair protein RecN (Recombination protein N)
MLAHLLVKDFAIVGEADIEFGPGLTAISGETGAGKSLLVDALLLLAGARGESGVVRQGAERAELYAEFRLVPPHPALDWLRAQELDEDGACQVRRVVRAEGGSRAYINGRPASMAQLKALGALLVEVHGQHEHQALLERPHQLAILDRFGGHEALLATVAGKAREWRRLGDEIVGLSGNDEDLAARLELLDHQIGELERDALAPDALAELGEEHRRLANAGSLLRGAGEVMELLDGEGDLAVLGILARALQQMEKLAALDARLEPVARLLDEASIQLGEASAELRRYAEAMDLDPERLTDVEARLARIHDLARKYRVPEADLTARAGALRQERERLAGSRERLDALAQARDRALTEWKEAAEALGKARAASASRLAEAVGTMLAELGMKGARFEAVLEASADQDPDPQGAERVEFLFSANPGQAPKPLRKVASGGELSRVSLAIEVAALDADDVPTMVFDEVDAGIGGAVAEVVGAKMRRLGERRQVLCVTHLAQVASQGHHHLRASKSTASGDTRTRIETLDETARVEEIARMLGGVEVGAESRALAKRMLGLRA